MQLNSGHACRFTTCVIRSAWGCEAGVPESTRADILWHSHAGMTAHYSVAQVVEIREAPEKITDQKHANNVSLASRRESPH